MTIKDHARIDGWANIITGLGITGRDKRMGAVPLPLMLSQSELDDLYRADDIAQKIVNKVPSEFYRTGYNIVIRDDADTAKEIKDYFADLDIDDKFLRACRLARLYGGAGVVLGVDDGQDASMPVNYNGIREIKWATVLDRWQLVPREIQTDLSQPDYGLPTLYQINSPHAGASGVLVHANRIIRFDGVEIPERAFIANNYWGDSVLSACFNNLRNFNTAHDGIATLLQDFNQTVFELENLSDMLAAGDDDLVRKRLALIDATRSLVRAIVIQKGEGFRRDSANLSGVADTVRLLANRLVASTNMPHTLILGEGSQGNTSGRSEEIDFYNLVAHEQVVYLKPRMMKLIELICAAHDGPDVEIEDVDISFNALWEMDALEEAQIYKTRAEADAIYISNGVVDPDEVARTRFAANDSEINIDLEAREEMQAAATAPVAPTGGETVQELALNGAQVTSLMDILTRVTSGEIPQSSASAVIQAAFPAIDDKLVQKILAPLKVQKPVVAP